LSRYGLTANNDIYTGMAAFFTVMLPVFYGWDGTTIFQQPQAEAGVELSPDQRSKHSHLYSTFI
jgi:hypothetical protein